MLTQAGWIIATFTSPQEMGTDAKLLLWLLPLLAGIAVVYKAIKLPEISAPNFIKEVIIVFATITIFMALTALGLSVAAWIVTE